MTGVVTRDLEAVVRLQIAAPDGAYREFSAVIDTGFNGYLTLPPHLVKSMGLPVSGHTEAELGDASRVMLPTHLAEVEWFGHRREASVLASDGGIMLGMALLQGHRLIVDIEPEGGVSVSSRS